MAILPPENAQRTITFFIPDSKKIPEECVPFANVKKKLYINPI